MISENNLNKETTLINSNYNSLDSINLSKEQQIFIKKALEGNNILVDACIGSGKTTAIQYLCNAVPKEKKILYLTYNKLLKISAKSKIKNSNVTVTNYHGFAFNILKKNNIVAGFSDSIQIFLKEKPQIPKYDVLIIDEYQDIEQESADLIEYIKSKNLLIQLIVVGDKDQKIYDKTTINLDNFIENLLEKHLNLKFTICYRLSHDIADKFGHIWNKTILGVNNNCKVDILSKEEAVDFLVKQEPKNILCLGSRTSEDFTDVLNYIEAKFPDKFNKKTVWATIRDGDSTGATMPKNNSAIFTTYDGCKGLERLYCFVFDFTEDYWKTRAESPNQSYEILRNIFCVAASRGKERIIFVRSKHKLLTEKILCTKFGREEIKKHFVISKMFDFKFKENIEECFSMLKIKPILTENNNEIKLKSRDGLIDLSPCIGIYQEAIFFDEDHYNINKEAENLLSKKDKKKYFGNTNELSLEQKILYLIYLENKQERYIEQVRLPLINEQQKKEIVNRLSTEFNKKENTQVTCNINFIEPKNGDIFSIGGLADVIKNNVVYELKFVSELTHVNFLQCACYMVALKLQKGILWNVKNNMKYELTIPNVSLFLDCVIKTITKNEILKYYEPTLINKTGSNFAIIDTETNFNDEVMSIGVVISNSKNFNVIEKKYYIISPECTIEGKYSDKLVFKEIMSENYSRKNAVDDVLNLFKKYDISCIFAYNAHFDFSHLPELSEFNWYDIMKVAMNKKFNSKIQSNMEISSNGNLKRNYGEEEIMKLLSGDKEYKETHNALCDAIDELKIMKLLNHGLEAYSFTKLYIKKAQAKENKVCSSFKSINLINVTPSYYYVDDVAKILQVSKSSIYKLINNNLLKAQKSGNKYIIYKEDLNSYIKYNENQQKKLKLLTIIYCFALLITLIIVLIIWFS